MAGRDERFGARSLLLYCLVFAFACLLLGGGSRLIGTQQEDMPVSVRSVSLVRAALTGAPAMRAETGSIAGGMAHVQRGDLTIPPEKPILNLRVLSDANGNVLSSRSYLRTVYQAFTLGDGFA